MRLGTVVGVVGASAGVVLPKLSYVRWFGSVCAAALLGAGGVAWQTNAALGADVEITTDTPTVNLNSFVGTTARVAPGVIVSSGVTASAQAWMLTNQGTINGNNTISLAVAGSSVTNQNIITGNNAITLAGGGDVVNAAGATITGAFTAVILGIGGAPGNGGGPGTVDNYGTITGGSAEAVTLFDGGTVINRAGATITTATGVNAVSVGQGTSRTVINSGVIGSTRTSGFSTGVVMQGGASTLTNTATGQIFGDYNGVFTSSSAPLTLTNNGSINSNRGSAVEAGGGGDLVNTGTIGSTLSNGILFTRSGTITNSGTIGGAANAITFANGPAGSWVHTLILQTGSVLNGNVVGATANSTDNLVLQGTGTESLAKFLNFETLSMQGVDWTLSNTGTFSTGATVQNGLLRVNGTLTSPLTLIGSGGTLGGTGTIVGAVTNNGTIAPGNSIGTLNITGSYTQASGSTYLVEVDNSPASDRINVTGAATIQSGTGVSVLVAPGLYALGRRYTILTASSGVTGTYSTLVDNAPFVDFSLAYDPNNVFLDVSRSTVSFAQVARTPNQRAAATGVENLGVGNAVFDAVLLLDLPGAQRAFDRLSGEGHATARGTLIDESRFLRDAVIGRLQQWSGGLSSLLAPAISAFRLDGEASEAEEALAYAAKAPRRGVTLPAPPPRYFTAWGQLIGNWGRTESDGNAATSKRNSGGVVSGIDVTLNDVWRFGVATGFQHTAFDIDDRATSGGIETYHLAGYAGTRQGAWRLRAGASYSWHDLSTTRQVAFPGFADTLRANYDAGTGQAFGEVGYGVNYGRVALEPFAALAHVRVAASRFTEAGGAAALTAAGERDGVTFATLGLRAATTLDTSWPTTLRGSLGWRHAFGGVIPTSTFAFNSGAGTPFTVAGVPIAKDALAIEAGIDARVTAQMMLGVSYTGQLSDNAYDHAIKGSLTAQF